MTPREKPGHALFVKWRDLEIGAFGIPAIIAVIIMTVVLAKWWGII